MTNRYRPTWAEINLDHLWHNYQEAASYVPDKVVIPVIKANAYGHGAVEVMKHLYLHGVRFYAVSLLEEALELRKVYDDIDILMLGPVMHEDLRICSKNRIEFTVYDMEIAKHVLHSKYPLICHLKVDTGMTRYGITEPNEIIDTIDSMQASSHVHLKGLFTHFATANDNEEIYRKQLDQMSMIIKKIKKLPEMIHISNSSSTFKYEFQIPYTTHVRLGISLYGLTLNIDQPDIKPVMQLKSKVVQIKELKPGDCVGYGATYCAKENERVAILPIGYADGFLRKNKTGSVEIHQKKYKIVGIICMDACFIKVDDQIKVGDVATLFGGIITIDDVARRLNTINYEVITSISSRVPRVYITSHKGE